MAFPRIGHYLSGSSPTGPQIAGVQASPPNPVAATTDPSLQLQGTNNRPTRFTHKNHKHISENVRQEILNFDTQLQQALADGCNDQQVAQQLSDLLDKSFFGAASRSLRLPSELFFKIQMCPLNANDKERASFIEPFVEGCLASINASASSNPDSDQLRTALTERARRFLASDRLGVMNLAREIRRLLSGPSHSAQRCSAQKMALETFQKAFPLAIPPSDGDRDHIGLLNKLIKVLPHLEHHPIVERNAQRRGLRVLEAALDRLPPNAAAEVTAHLMDTVTRLSTQYSQRAANKAIGTSTFLTGVTSSTLGVFALMGVSILGPFTAIPVGVGVTAFAASGYLGIEKQAQGTALYTLNRQLSRLRDNWHTVSKENKQALIKAFNTMKNNIVRLLGTRERTLTRFFNDPTIDPSSFSSEHPQRWLGTMPKRFHRVVVPFTSRLNGVSELINRSSSLQPDWKTLIQLLLAFQTQLKHSALQDKSSQVVVNWLILKGKLESDQNKRGVSCILDCFKRITESPEFSNADYRPHLQLQAVKMAKALTDGNNDFLQLFAGTAELARADCHNNARQIFRQLWNVTLLQFAVTGKDGLDDHKALLKLAHDTFRKDVLRKVVSDGIGAFVKPSVEVEHYLAAEILLSSRLGLRDPVAGMSYRGAVSKFVNNRQKMEELEKLAIAKIENREAFIDFLMEYSPLTERIKGEPKYKTLIDDKEKALRAEFDAAEEKYYAIRDTCNREPTEEEEITFEAAGLKYQSSVAELGTQVLRSIIEEHIEKFPDVMLINPSTDPDLDTSSVDGPIPPSHEMIDPELFAKFEASIDKVHRELDYKILSDDLHDAFDIGDYQPEEVGTSRIKASNDQADVYRSHLQSNPVSTRQPILLEHRLFSVQDNPGGGDCMLHALGASSAAGVAEMRENIANVIAKRDDTPLKMSYNANQITAILLQTPQTSTMVQDLTFGRYSIPNQVYANLVRIPGIYIGDEELTAFSELAENRGKRFVVVDRDGTLMRISDGVRTTIDYTPENREKVLATAINEADIALYKTSQHWQRIEKPITEA